MGKLISCEMSYKTYLGHHGHEHGYGHGYGHPAPHATHAYGHGLSATAHETMVSRHQQEVKTGMSAHQTFAEADRQRFEDHRAAMHARWAEDMEARNACHENLPKEPYRIHKFHPPSTKKKSKSKGVERYGFIHPEELERPKWAYPRGKPHYGQASPAQRIRGCGPRGYGYGDGGYKAGYGYTAGLGEQLIEKEAEAK